MPEQCFAFGPFTLDAARGTLAKDGQALPAGHRAVALLHALVRANGRVVTKAELIQAAWPRSVIEESNLSVQIAALRKTLGPAPDGGDCIATVARVGYRLRIPVAIAGGVDTAAGPTPSGLPSIAVLPLVNLSGDAQQEYFADGVTEDIIIALSRFRWFRVIGRSSSFAFKGRAVGAREIAERLGVRYLIEGSVRKSAERVRISLELTDAPSQRQLWGEHYDFDAKDGPTIEDAIAEQVAGAIEPELLKTESSVAARHPLADMTAHDLVHRGTWLFHRIDRAGHRQARELFRQACRRDPAFGQAQFWLARVSAGIVAYGWSDDEPADLSEGIAAAIKAIHADEKDPYAHYALAIASVFAAQFEQAIRAAQRAVDLAPGFALGHLVLGMAQLYSGDAAAATGSLLHGLRLNPFDPQNFVWHNTLAYAQLFSGDAANALASARRARDIRPDWAPAIEAAVCCLSALGRSDAARDCAALLRTTPLPGGDALAPMRRRNPQWDDRIRTWLRDGAAHERR